jgi:hypothetical protein
VSTNPWQSAAAPFKIDRNGMGWTCGRKFQPEKAGIGLQGSEWIDGERLG